jgi:phosphoribosylformylglycinamidine synthase
METHNSPSAISPYGGASTGVVGVHRDILGTGLGAMPIANWDVLCFEEPGHRKLRPKGALDPEVVRLGVVKGVEDGGNQSGIPTVQGSVVFHPSYAVKPLVFAGCLGILPKDFVEKKAQVGDTLYCVGGAVGLDGLRGAVMSSRDIRKEDFVGSMVQVANAFVQRRMTDFLLEARDKNLLSCVTDNGAGGLASSVGEMARFTNGASIDLSHLRLKYQGLHGWERLVSESQERMTVATSQTQEFEELAKKWAIPLDKIGTLNESARFEVQFQSHKIVDIDLSFLHEACPQLQP